MPTIVLGCDASGPGERSARGRARRRLRRRLVIGFGVQPPGHGGGEGMEHRNALREQAAQLTGEALARAIQAGVSAEVSLVDERQAVALAGLGEEHDARMIVVGSYGESPIKEILGSTPHKLLHLSDRPVLVVPGG